MNRAIPVEQQRSGATMDDVMFREAARELSAKLKSLLDQSLAPEIRLTRDEAILAQAFAESVADMLTEERGHQPR